MKLLGTILTTISLFLGSVSLALAYTQYSQIGATVKISVCGNNIVEDMEDCEMSQAQTFNCKDFGFQPKEIKCDSSCAYDLLSCVPIVPPKEPEDSGEEIPTAEIPELPTLLTVWDSNHDGKLELSEFTSFIKTWVNDWKSFLGLTTDQTEQEKIEVAKECDVNSDGVCSLKDFSIILYHYTNE